MTIFTEALKLIEQNRIKDSFRRPNEKAYEIESKTSKTTNRYIYKIYRKTTSWFSQCDCDIGISYNYRLCKHAYAGLISEFLKQNKLKMVKE
jgi:hypothetical protein